MILGVRIGLALTVGAAAAQAQELLLNGDFENLNGTGCLSNQSNAQLGNVLPSLTGFGTANEIDVYNGFPCYGLAPISGATKVGIDTQGTNGNSDGFSFGLIAPIAAGSGYTLSFWAETVTYSQPGLGEVRVGISNDPLSFGTLVYSGTCSAPDVWTPFSATFTAPSSASYLTVQSGAPGAWTHVDGFSLKSGNVTSFCVPGTNGVLACPCGNTAGAGLGCANTGSAGASLASTGVPDLASDAADPGAFHLTGTSLLSGSTAIFLQGDAVVPGGGVSFGAGVRCVAGQMLRLYVKTISGGSATAPAAGDRSISNRAVDLGAPIPGGSTRNYQIYYRDPGQANPGPPCPTNNTFNITRGLSVIWI